MTVQIAVAGFVIARADDELWALDVGGLAAGPAPAGSTTQTVRADQVRLREQALARRELAEHYLRLHDGPRPVDPVKAAELLRAVCLMARLDRDHPDYAAAIDGCPLDCDNPLW